MLLINQTKTEFMLGLDAEGKSITFKVGEVKDFNEKLSSTLLKYEGVSTIDSLKAKSEQLFADATPTKSEFDLLKEEATGLGIDFPGNVSKAKLIEMIEEAKTAPEVA